MNGLGKTEQEEFAASFTDTFASAAVTAGEFAIARQVYETLQERFPGQPRPPREGRQGAGPARQGRQARARRSRPRTSRARPSGSNRSRASTSWSTSGPPGARRASPSCRGSRTPTASTTTRASRSSASASTRPEPPWSTSSRCASSPGPRSTTRTAGADLVEAFGVSSIPAAYLIDPEGKIIRLDLRGPVLETTLAQLMPTMPKTTK